MNNNTTYKDSPLGKIPSDWEVKSIEDICKVFVGRDLNENIFSLFKTDEFNIPVYSNTVENQGLYGYYKVEEFAGESLTVVGRGAGLGMAFTRNSKFGAIGRLLVLFPKKDVCAHYVTEFINGALRIHRESGGIPQLTGEQISKYKISIPIYPEQTRIAEVLSAWDKAISNLQATIDQVELRNKWLMQELLTGKRRLKGFGGEWKEYHLGDMFSERNETRNDELPLLSVGQNGIYPQSDSIKKDISNEDKSKYKRICVGDIGYNTMRMWQGRSALSNLEGIVSPAYTILIPRKMADSLFFSYLFKTPKLMNLFWRNSQGLVDDTLNCKYKDFSIIKLHLPDKDEQTAIAQVLQAATKEVQVLQNKLDKLKEQKKGLTQVLLTGKKRLKTN